MQSDEEINEYARRAAQTVYHPAGTTKMGDVNIDKFAVVDPQLKDRSIKDLLIADAGMFPEMVTVNLMLTVLSVGERCAKMMAIESWQPAAHL